MEPHSPVHVLWKNLETNAWQGPDPLITTGRGYACDFPEHEWQPRWLPLRCIKPVTATDRTHEKILAGKLNPSHWFNFGLKGLIDIGGLMILGLLSIIWLKKTNHLRN
jgi:hypothetical protein